MEWTDLFESQFPLLQGLLHLIILLVVGLFVTSGLNSHCCRGYCIGFLTVVHLLGPLSQFPLLQGLLHLGRPIRTPTRRWSQFPLLQGLLHLVSSGPKAGDTGSQFPLLQGLLHPMPVGTSGLPCLNSHCCRGYCIPSDIRGLPSCET